jgi:hypothetical protein
MVALEDKTFDELRRENEHLLLLAKEIKEKI